MRSVKVTTVCVRKSNETSLVYNTLAFDYSHYVLVLYSMSQKWTTKLKEVTEDVIFNWCKHNCYYVIGVFGVKSVRCYLERKHHCFKSLSDYSRAAAAIPHWHKVNQWSPFLGCNTSTKMFLLRWFKPHDSTWQLWVLRKNLGIININIVEFVSLKINNANLC